MQKNTSIFLIHILESIDWIERETENIAKDKFIQNVPTQDIVIRRLEIIGEAVKNLSAEFRKEYPNIPWKKIAGLRDKLIHGYFVVDLELVWGIIKKDIPPLKEQVKKILSA